jgi:hypothetical protein
VAGDRHGPNRLTNYQDTHNTIIQQFLREGFILSEDLLFVNLGNGFLVIEGTLQCAGGIAIDVAKRLQIVGGDGANALVENVGYSYNVLLRGIGNIFRYDSPHPDHNRGHHVHRFDVLQGDREGEVIFHPSKMTGHS